MGASAIVFKPMSGKKIDSIALAVLGAVQPTVLKGREGFDIERFVDVVLEDLTGITPDYSYELPDGIYGITDTLENRMVINAELAEDFLQRKFLRSTLAHEAGHCILHVPLLREYKKQRVFQQKKNDSGSIKLYRENNDIPLYQNPEWQAWRFAGALLVPELPLKQLLERGSDINKIAEVFNVNSAFLKSRMRALKLSK